MTTVLHVDAAHPDPDAIARAADRLRRGGLVAFPTETVYGLGVCATDVDAVRRLFVAKGRPATDPLIVHVGSFAEATPLVRGVPAEAAVLAERFWPGPLTLVMPRSSLVPDEVTAGLDTVAIRVPAHPVARALIDAAGVPIAAPSANLFSRPSPTRASHVLDDLRGRIDMVLDGGPTSVGVESTVLDLSRDVPTILRPGAVTIAMLLDVIPRVQYADPACADQSQPMRSPGLLERHYSPRAPLTLYIGTDRAVIDRLVVDARRARSAGQVVGIIAAAEDRPQLGDLSHVVEVGAINDVSAIASAIYGALRQLDAEQVDLILVRSFPTGEGLGIAIHDRLRRAAAGRVVQCDTAESMS